MNSNLSDPYEEGHQSSSEVDFQQHSVDKERWVKDVLPFLENNFPTEQPITEHISQIMERSPRTPDYIIAAELAFRTQNFRFASQQFYRLWTRQYINHFNKDVNESETLIDYDQRLQGFRMSPAFKFVGQRYVEAALLSADWQEDSMQEVVYMLGINDVNPYSFLTQSDRIEAKQFPSTISEEVLANNAHKAQEAKIKALTGSKNSNDWIQAAEMAKLELLALGWKDDFSVMANYHRCIVQAAFGNPDAFTEFQISSLITFNDNVFEASGRSDDFRPIANKSNEKLKSALARKKLIVASLATN